MNLLKEIGLALLEVIKWPGIVYRGLCDSLGVSEWTVFFMTIGVIAIFFGGRSLIRYFRNK